MNRSFSTSVTSDPVFCALPPTAQLLYFRLYLHPGNHLCGLFAYSVAHMAVDLQATLPEATEALNALVKEGFVELDRTCDLVWMPEMAKRLGDITGKKNTIAPAVSRYLAGVCSKKSALVNRVSHALLKTPLDTPSDRVSDTPADAAQDRSLTGSGTALGSEDPPIPPASGGPSACPEVSTTGKQPENVQASSPLPGIASEPAKAPRTPRKQVAQAEIDKHTPTAKTLLAELSLAIQRVRPSARPLRPLESNLMHIRARLLEGHTADDIRHVIAVCEARARHDQKALQYFDAHSPFLKRNIGMWLAKTVEDSAKPQVQPPPPVRFGPPPPEEVERINRERRESDDLQAERARAAIEARRRIAARPGNDEERAAIAQMLKDCEGP